MGDVSFLPYAERRLARRDCHFKSVWEEWQWSYQLCLWTQIGWIRWNGHVMEHTLKPAVQFEDAECIGCVGHRSTLIRHVTSQYFCWLHWPVLFRDSRCSWCGSGKGYLGTQISSTPITCDCRLLSFWDQFRTWALVWVCNCHFFPIGDAMFSVVHFSKAVRRECACAILGGEKGVEAKPFRKKGYCQTVQPRNLALLHSQIICCVLGKFFHIS